MHIRILLETARIDDVVGAVPVHLAAGVYGTLIAGLTNGDASVGVQILGILAVGAFTFLAAFATWLLVQRVVGIRPARTEEEAGADPTEARFAGLIPSDELSLVPRALSGGLVVQDFKRFGTQITEILEECREDRSGEIASYIPQLARVDTEHFALGLCMVDGQLLSFGDDEERYCVQSTCKPVNYAVARDLLDREKVHRCSPACGAGTVGQVVQRTDAEAARPAAQSDDQCGRDHVLIPDHARILTRRPVRLHHEEVG